MNPRSSGVSLTYHENTTRNDIEVRRTACFRVVNNEWTVFVRRFNLNSRANALPGIQKVFVYIATSAGEPPRCAAFLD